MPRHASHPIRIALAGLIAMAAAMGLGRFSYTPILPYMIDGLGITRAQAGLIASFNLLGYIAGAIAVSRARLPGSKRAWLLGSIALSGSSMVAMGAFTTMIPFLVLRFLAGIASALVTIFGAALVLEGLALARRPNLSAIHFGGPGWGIALSALIVGGLAPFHADWAGLWLATGLACLAGLCAVWSLMPRFEGAMPPPESLKAASPPWEPRLIALAACYGLYGFGYIITATFVSVIARTSPTLRPFELYVWLVVGVAAVPSVMFWNWMGRRLGNDRACALALFTEACGVVMTVIGGSTLVLALAAILFGGTINGIGSLAYLHARDLTSGDARPIFARLSISLGVGQIVGPIFAGYVAESTGSFRAPSLTAAAALALAGLIITVSRNRPGVTVAHPLPSRPRP